MGIDSSWVYSYLTWAHTFHFEEVRRSYEAKFQVRTQCPTACAQGG